MQNFAAELCCRLRSDGLLRESSYSCTDSDRLESVTDAMDRAISYN